MVISVLGVLNLGKVKSINSLMAYMRDYHDIRVLGSDQKRALRNIGYYHGYKGYRYINNPDNKINFSDFNEILAINDLDIKLKSLFYPKIMFIETAIKNYVLEVILDEGQSESFHTIYTNLLTDYKRYTNGSSRYKDAFKRRLDLQNSIYGVLTRDYRNNKRIVQHFYHKDQPVPIWAIFETISLGEFGHFVSCLNTEIKQKVSANIGLNRAFDPEGRLTQTIIYIIKDLRNSIAHNDVVFDARFKSSKIGNSLTSCLENDTMIRNISFSTIVDYLVLVVYILSKLRIPRTELKKLISDFEKIIECFREQIPISVYSQIIHTDTRNKLIALKKYISSY